MNSQLDKEKLVLHLHHDIAIVGYGNADEYSNLALECNTCNEVLADADVNQSREE